MFTRIARCFTTNKTYGNLRDADRIFTNVYRDSDAYISGALRRVIQTSFRETGTTQKIFYSTDPTGSSTKSNSQDSEEEEELDSPRVSSIPSCPKSPLLKDQATWSSTLINQNQGHAKTEKL